MIVDDAKTALAASNAPSLKAIEASPAAGVADNLANDGETAVPVLETTWTVLKGPRRLDAASAPEMVETCTSLLDANPRVVLDLSETVLLASAGLAALAQLNRTADERDGELRVANCSKDVMRVIEMVRFDKVLALYNDVPAAVA